MKNKKLLTALVSIIMGGTAIGGCVSLTACKNNNNGNSSDNTPTHNWSTTEYGKDDVNHWRVCTDDGCDLIYQVTPHDFTNGDCVCGQPKPSSGKPDDGTGDEDDDKDKAGLVSITAYDHTQNGSRVTQRLQKLFKVGDTFNTTNLVVEATSKVDGQDKVETLKLSDLEIEKPDMTTAGEKTVVIKYGGKETSYTINIIDLSGVSKNEATVTVNQTAPIGATGNVVTVNGINDAVQVFKLLGTDANTTKTINITAGTYHEKVEFDIPNLHVVGADADATKTVIEYDLLAAYICPGAGKAYSTDGSATVSVRAAAIGFHAENITFQNYYNTHERYLQSKEIADKLDGNTMAVACLVQADQCVFDNVRFSSYHDTLYDHNGRHVYNNCFIEGRTDYVFGYGATSLFNNCTLNTIGANDAKNGGYVCATRGFVKHVNDWTTADTVIDYGYIFNGCTFTNDSNVQDGTVSLARAWSGHMTLAFIECNMSKAYAKTAYGSTTDNKNKRYGSMSQGDPNPERLYEYGNTGEGALDYASLGTGKVDNLCTVLTETEKDTFLDKSVIFAAKNGQYEYSSAWNGEAGVIVPVTYNFAFGEQAKNWVDTNGEYADLIDGISVNGKYKLNGNSIQFSVGTVIKMKLAGKISVDWFGTNWGTANNGIITYKNGCATLTIVADKTGGTDGQNGVYIKNIVLDGTQQGVHVHDYGDWTIDTDNYPTTESEGLATRTCQDCELETAHVDQKVLPVLTTENYNITASQTEGKSIYTLKTDESISFEADALAGVHVHHYGEWEVKTENMPTADDVGAVTRTCTDDDCNHDNTAIESKELPKLDDSRYTITDNTATVESAGEGIYTITIDGIDEPVSFTAATPKLTTTTFNFADYDTSAKPATFFDGKVTVNSNYWMQGEAIKVFTGDIIVINVQGSISVTWWGGSLGSEANGKITYKDGCATLKIIDADNGIYVKSITVDHTDIPADTATYTVSVYVLGDGEPVKLGDISGVVEGESISSEQIVALLSASSEYASSEIDKVYASDKTTEYDYGAVNDDSDIFISLKGIELTAITEGLTLSKSSDLTSSQYAILNGVEVFNSNYLSLSADGEIKLSVKAGTTITVYADKYYGGATLNFGDGAVSADTETIEALSAEVNTFTYTATADKVVTITASKVIYFLCLNVDCGISYNTGDTILIGEYPGQCTQSKGGYHSVQIDATASTSAKLSVSGESGGYKYAQLNKDTVLSFNVADGITADNIKLVAYNGANLTADTDYTITVSDGVVTITVIKNTYIRLIQID